MYIRADDWNQVKLQPCILSSVTKWHVRPRSSLLLVKKYCIHTIITNTRTAFIASRYPDIRFRLHYLLDDEKYITHAFGAVGQKREEMFR